MAKMTGAQAVVEAFTKEGEIQRNKDRKLNNKRKKAHERPDVVLFEELLSPTYALFRLVLVFVVYGVKLALGRLHAHLGAYRGSEHWVKYGTHNKCDDQYGESNISKRQYTD